MSALSARDRSAVFGMRMPSSWLHRSCDSLARSVFLRARFCQPFCAVVPVMGALFQTRGWLPIVEAPGYSKHPTCILAMQLLITYEYL